MASVDQERPWGSFTVVADEPTFKGQRLVVLPGKRLSYQRHARRSEHWLVVARLGQVTLDGDLHSVSPGIDADVPVGTAHRIEITGS